MKCRIQAVFAIAFAPVLFPALFIWYRRHDFMVLFRDYLDGCLDALRHGDCDGLKP